MIPRNTAIPQEKAQRFVTNTANQPRVHVYVLEGDATDPDACTTIGDFRVTNLPANLPAGSPVEVALKYDTSGRIQAAARDLTGNNAASMEIVRDSGLDEQGLNAFQKLAQEYTVE
jgi:molecular chaperone DnaK